MPLRFGLAPFDKLYIGISAISNSRLHRPTDLAGRDGFDKYQGTYFASTVQAVSDAATAYAVIDQSDTLVRNREFCKALKNLKELIKADLLRVDRSDPGAYPPRGAVYADALAASKQSDHC